MAQDTANSSVHSSALAVPSGPAHFAVRVGLHGQVGRFRSNRADLQRGCQVVCRTLRGIERGVVLNRLTTGHSSGESLPDAAPELDGHILRSMAPEDHLLWSNLVALAGEAFANCQHWLAENQVPDQLLDVEPLLDGRTLYFHFLSSVSPATNAHVDKLAEIFEQTVATSSFAQQIETGCGPGCGTAKAKGCGSACSVCKVCSVR